MANPKPRLRLVPVLGTAAERGAFVKFVNRNYPSPVPMEVSAFKNPTHRYFYVELVGSSGRPKRVGTAGYIIKTRTLAETIKTTVALDYRGRGFGQRISELIEKELRARRFKKARSTIYTDNLPMLFIKLKQGYLFEGFHPDHERPGVHEYSLGKKLR